MLYLNHKKTAKTALVSILILLITLVLISNKIYSDIRGEFAKRPAALPPEPAAVVDYLKEDFSNLRAESSTLCFPGKTITVNLSQLGATPTFFEAIDQALRNSGMGAFTSKDFLEPQPDGISYSVNPQTPFGNAYYSIDNIEINRQATNITSAVTPKFSNTSSPPGDFTCSTYYPAVGQKELCKVLNSCGRTYFNSTLNLYVKNGGCLATATSPSGLSSITSSLNSEIVIEVLGNYIPRRKIYFSNPYYAKDANVYTFLTPLAPNLGNTIGCAIEELAANSICLSGGTSASSIAPWYSINGIATVSSTIVGLNISTVPRQSYVLAFTIKTCPKS